MDISSLRERKDGSVMSVTEINNYIKGLVENDKVLKAVSISGEISNFTRHTSGHLYFSLKDEASQIKAVMFRSSAERLPFVPENGMKVTVRGTISAYIPNGTYSISVYSLQPAGIGALYLAYEQLKNKLALEGLFDISHKKPLPKIPDKIGVITSPTGAAVRDIINVTNRRFPLAKIYIYPALVQGDGAEDSLLEALDYFDKSKLCDVIIIGRGGGSIEDLWAFNSERLARRIFDASTPVISAVGHEIDFTICDFVSDCRAPTPSAAAELAVPDIKDLYLQIDSYLERCKRALENQISIKKEKLKNLENSQKLKSAEFLFEEKRILAEQLYVRLITSANQQLKNKREAFAHLAEKLNALSPLSVLERGFAVPEFNGKRIKSVNELSCGDSFSLIFKDGCVYATVKSKEEKGNKNEK